MKHIFLISTFFLISTCFAQNINYKKLDSLFNSLSENNKIIGSIAIASNGNIVYDKSIGYSNIDENIISYTRTKYRIGSITKMLTAIMIFQLIEEGKLTLATPISKFFKGDFSLDKITISSLLKHKSGLYDFVNEGNDNDWLTLPQKKQSILDTILKGKRHFQPDTDFLYSNSSYFLLSNIIEKIENKKYHKIINKRIFSKIGLKNTLCLSSNINLKDEALSYKYNKKWEKIKDFSFTNVTGVGDVLSSPSDLTLIMKSLFNGDLISEKSLSLMKTFESNPFGMGIMKTPFYNKMGYGHAGDTYGTHSVTAYYPDDNLTISFCINGGTFSRNELAIAVLKICFNQKYTIPTFKDFEVGEEILNKYSGNYKNDNLPFKFNVFIKDNLLFAQATEQESIQLEATDYNKFKVEELNAFFEFDVENKKMTFKQGGAKFIFNKE